MGTTCGACGRRINVDDAALVRGLVHIECDGCGARYVAVKATTPPPLPPASDAFTVSQEAPVSVHLVGFSPPARRERAAPDHEIEAAAVARYVVEVGGDEGDVVEIERPHALACALEDLRVAIEADDRALVTDERRRDRGDRTEPTTDVEHAVSLAHARVVQEPPRHLVLCRHRGDDSSGPFASREPWHPDCQNPGVSA